MIGELFKPVGVFMHFKSAGMISVLVSKSYHEQPFVKRSKFIVGMF